MKNLKPTYQEIVYHLLETNKIVLKIADEFTAFKIEDYDYYLIVLKSKNNGFYVNYQYGLDCGLEFDFVTNAKKNSLVNNILDSYYHNLNHLKLTDGFDLKRRCEIAYELIKNAISKSTTIHISTYELMSELNLKIN
jgi:methyl coenzyme M reductase alpha subunit